jgi:hypothetical protein
MQIGYKPNLLEVNRVIYYFKLYVEIKTPLQPLKKLRFLPKAYLNAYNSTIPIRIKEDRI